MALSGPRSVDFSSFWTRKRDSKVLLLAVSLAGYGAHSLPRWIWTTRGDGTFVLGAAPNSRCQHQSRSRRIKSKPGSGRVESRESRLMEETLRIGFNPRPSSTRLDSTGLGWAEPCAARAGKAQQPKPDQCPRGAEQPIQQEAVRTVCPFLNGILLATEENQGCNRPCALPCSHSPLLHAASLCLLSLALIPCSPALLLHMHLPLLRASSQRAILPHPPPPPTLPPRPTLLYQLRHTTRTYTNTLGIQTYTHTNRDRKFPPPSVPNYGNPKSASAVISSLPLYPIGRSAQPVQLYKTREREPPGRGFCSATLLCMNTRTTRTTPNPSFAADHTQAPILAAQPFPAPICFSTPAHLAQH